jgi:DUF305 family protein family protein
MSHSIAQRSNQFILNWVLIENPACGVHVRDARGLNGLPRVRLGDPSKDIGETQRLAAEIHARNVWLRLEVEMVLFSRAFIRKRVISLATTASVAATSFALAQDPTRTHHVRGAVQYAADRQEHLEEQPFLSENATAMHKMMADMIIKPTGDIDRDFVEMMVPHHQGAVDMAKAELKFGRNEQLRRLAQRIVATQQREIAVMQNAVSDGKPSVAQSPEQSRAAVPQLESIDGSAADGGMGMSR